MRSLVRPMIWMLFAPALGIGLSACGEEPEEPSDLDAPTVELVFPTQDSAVESRTLIIRGTAADSAGVAAVRVAGVLASSDNGFADWQAEVSLEPGLNTVSIEAEDTLGNADVATTLTVTSSKVLRLWPEAIVLDEAANRILVVDGATRSLVTMDATTGERRELSPGWADDGSYLGTFGDLALDRDGNRVLGIHGGGGGLMAIDLDTGARTFLAEPGTAPSEPTPHVSGMAMDPAAGRLLAVEMNSKALIALDLATGAPTVISDATTGAGPAFVFPSDVALDAARGRALVVDRGLHALLAVDLATGNRSVLSDGVTGAGPALEYPSQVILQAEGERILVESDHDILAVDPDTGDRTMISSSDVADAPPLSVGSVELDTANGRLVAAGFYYNGLVTIDLGSGERTALGYIAVGSGPTMDFVHDVQLDPSSGRAVMVRYTQLVTMDLPQGERQSIDVVDDDFLPVLAQGVAMAFDPRTNQALVIDTEPFLSQAMPGDAGTVAAALAAEALGPRPALIAIDLETSAARYVANLSEIMPIQVELDAPRNRALLFDGVAPILWGVDLDTGEIEIVADMSAGPDSVTFTGFAVDPSRNWAVVTDIVRQRVWAIDLATSEPSVLMEQNLESSVGSPDAVTMDLPRNRVLVVDSPGSRITAIDLDTRERSVVFDTQSRADVVPQWLTAPAMDEAHEVGLVLDEQRRALIMLDFATGASAVIAL